MTLRIFNPDANENNPPQHLFVDDKYGSTQVRKQDISYFLPQALPELQAIRDFLDFEKWSGLTQEEKNQIYDLVQIEVARRNWEAK